MNRRTFIASTFTALVSAKLPATPVTSPFPWDSLESWEGKTFAEIWAEHENDPTFFLTHPDHVRMIDWDYTRIVDHKTGHVDRNVRQVLRGKIDGFIRADLMYRMGV